MGSAFASSNSTMFGLRCPTTARTPRMTFALDSGFPISSSGSKGSLPRRTWFTRPLEARELQPGSARVQLHLHERIITLQLREYGIAHIRRKSFRNAFPHFTQNPV